VTRKSARRKGTRSQPLVVRIDYSKSIAQPGAGIRVQPGRDVIEIGLVSGSHLFRFIEELNLRREVRNATRVAPDCLRKQSPNRWLTTIHPIIPVGLVKHQLQYGHPGLARTKEYVARWVTQGLREHGQHSAMGLGRPGL
jgi:hypothetical protein